MAELFSRTVSAGTRLYYFDVRADKKGQRYITITEQSRDGRMRRSIFLHREDFGKFTEALSEAVAHCT